MLVELHPVFAQVYNVPLIVNVVYCFHRRLFQVTAIGSLTHGLAADVWTFWRFFGLLQIFVNASRVVKSDRVLLENSLVKLLCIV